MLRVPDRLAPPLEYLRPNVGHIFRSLWCFAIGATTSWVLMAMRYPRVRDTFHVKSQASVNNELLHRNDSNDQQQLIRTVGLLKRGSDLSAKTPDTESQRVDYPTITWRGEGCTKRGI
jgi:hypothetical protein